MAFQYNHSTHLLFFNFQVLCLEAMLTKLDVYQYFYVVGTNGLQSRSRSSYTNSSSLSRQPLTSNNPSFYSRVSPSPPKIYSPDKISSLLPRQPHFSDFNKSEYRDASLTAKYSQTPLKSRITETLNKYPPYYSGTSMGSSAGKPTIPRISPTGVTSGSAGSNSSHSNSSSDGHLRSSPVVKEQLVPNGNAYPRPRSGSRSRQSSTIDRNSNSNVNRPLPDLPNSTSSKPSLNKANTLPPPSSTTALRSRGEMSPSPPSRQTNGKMANGTLSISGSSATVASGTPASISTRSRTSSTSSLSSGPQGNGTNGASNYSGPSNSSGFSSSTAGSKGNNAVVANGKPPSGASANWTMRVGSTAPEARNDASRDRGERSSASPSSNSSTPQHPGINGTTESNATRPEFTQLHSNGSFPAIDEDDSPYPRRRVQSPSPSHTSTNNSRGYVKATSPDVHVARPANGTSRASPHVSRDTRERAGDRTLPSITNSNNRFVDDDDDDDEDAAPHQEQVIAPQTQGSRDLSTYNFLKVCFLALASFSRFCLTCVLRVRVLESL